MNAEEFIEQVVKYVRDPSVTGTFGFLLKPPGRKPRERHVRISNWLNQLPEEQQDLARQVIEDSVDAAMFNILCVFDGVKKIEDKAGDSQYQLVYEAEGCRNLINDPNQDYLHDIYNDLVPTR